MMQFNNHLDLPPPKPVVVTDESLEQVISPTPSNAFASIQTEFNFELPKGYLDSEGNLHRRGTMRLSMAMDEIVPMRDPRVKSNLAYATVLILSRVILRLGALNEITPQVVEGLFAGDLNYLQTFYRQINGLEVPSHSAQTERSPSARQPLPSAME